MKRRSCFESMCECQVINALPPEALEDLRQLYISAGWITPEEDGRFLVPVLKQSAVAVAVFDGGQLVGFGRALSDNCSDAYIQDVVVAPDHRKRGIGGMIVRRIVRELRGRGVDWIGLAGEPGTEHFYAGLGFNAMPRHTLWIVPDDAGEKF